MSEKKDVKKFKSHNAEGEIQKVYEQDTDDQITEKIKQGNEAFNTYKCQELQDRKKKLIKLAEILEDNAKQDAQIMCEEMGKPFSEAEGEVLKSANHCRYYADNLEEFLKPQEKEVQNQKQLVYSEPIGVVYIITPFNFPHFQIFKPAIANLALGNAVLVRPASTIPRCGLNIEQRFKEAGFGNMYQNVFASSSQLDLILGNDQVKGVSFTGSTKAGSSIASKAGKYLKKHVMELGGSDPFIVLEDADIKKAVKLAIQGRLKNCGQICTSSKRFLIHENIYDEFKNRLVEEVKSLKVSYPMEEGVDLGPMAREDLLENVEKQVEKSVEQGGKKIFGGKRLNKKGNFYQPAIVEVESQDNVLLQEETFGPVFPLMKFKNDLQALQLANNSEYGLGSSVIGEEKHAEKIAEKINAGMVFVNNITQSNSALPFGGTKNSGYGRECGIYGFQEFSNRRLLWIA